MSSSEAELRKIDWDFFTLENEGLHRVHWYPATFLAALPGSLIPLLSGSNAVVLDPFCGVGTTGVESVRLGRRFVGIDVNPIATLVTKAKLGFPNTRALMTGFGSRDTLWRSQPYTDSGLTHPNEQELLDWYDTGTYRELISILLSIRDCRDIHVRRAAQAVFSSILKNVSSQPRHWGWVCDNVKPHKDEIRHKNAPAAFSERIHSFSRGIDWVLDDMRSRDVSMTRKALRRRSRVYCDDALHRMGSLAAGSVDLIVTSPPYYGVADYVKSQRLSFLWFHDAVLSVEGHSTTDFEALRRREVGCRSYRRRRTSFDEYVGFMRQFLASARRVLKPGSHLCLVFGQSRAREETSLTIHSHALQVGFRQLFRESRKIRKTRRRMMARVPSEEVLVYTAVE